MNWSTILQTFTAGLLLATTIGIFKFGGAVERWYHANERRMVQLELARVRHALRLERVEDHLEETNPGKFFRRRAEDLVSQSDDE